MKTFTEFLTALAVLAIVQYITVALWIVLLIAAVMAATIRPRLAFATAVLIGTIALMIRQPVACAAVMAVISIAFVLANRMKPRPVGIPPAPLLLSHTPVDRTGDFS